jgi:hypothetical protein
VGVGQCRMEIFSVSDGIFLSVGWNFSEKLCNVPGADGCSFFSIPDSSSMERMEHTYCGRRFVDTGLHVPLSSFHEFLSFSFQNKTVGSFLVK